MQTAFLLITLGFGYKIFSEASRKSEKSVGQLGKLVGIVMMIVSFGGVLCSTWTAIKYGSLCGSSMYCPMPQGPKMNVYQQGAYQSASPHSAYMMGEHGKKLFCPMMGPTQSQDGEQPKAEKE